MNLEQKAKYESTSAAVNTELFQTSSDAKCTCPFKWTSCLAHHSNYRSIFLIGRGGLPPLIDAYLPLPALIRPSQQMVECITSGFVRALTASFVMFLIILYHTG